MSADLERSGDLAQHVAKLARLRYPERGVPRDLHAMFQVFLFDRKLTARHAAGRGKLIIEKSTRVEERHTERFDLAGDRTEDRFRVPSFQGQQNARRL